MYVTRWKIEQRGREVPARKNFRKPIERPRSSFEFRRRRPIDFPFPRAPLFHLKRRVEHFLQRDFTFDRHRVIERIGHTSGSRLDVFFPGCLLLLTLRLKCTHTSRALDEKEITKDSQYVISILLSHRISFARDKNVIRMLRMLGLYSYKNLSCAEDETFLFCFFS